MKKFLHELVLYFWIPIVVALVSYIFFVLNDATLGLSVLVASTVVYAMARLYYMYKKWWLWLIVALVVLGSLGIYFLRAPATTLTINNMEIAGTSMTLSEGTITINPAPQGNGQYMKNTVVTLTTEPAPGYDWIGWNGTDNDNANPTTVTMSDDKAVKVNFEVRYSLIINNQQVIGSVVSFDEGTVTVNPPPSNVDGKYSRNTTVTLTIHPNADYDWVSWIGTEDDSSNPTTITMNTGKQIMVTFSGRFELTINSQSVTNNILLLPEGSISINPPPGNDDKYANGTVVTLQANPYPGYGFDSWSGTDDYGSNPTTVTINDDKHVSVNWEQRYSVIINSQPLTSSMLKLTGGTITVNPAPDTGGTFDKNTKVTFTATPAAGYRFGWWGGEISGTTNTITVTVNTDKNISVVFIKTYNLTAVANPVPGGVITPASGTYDEGTSVTITAAASPGYRFGHWEGTASGYSPSVIIMMNADKTVVAVFVKTYRLTIAITPAGGGMVSPSSGTYDVGSNVTLTATPATGYRFDHWESDVSGNSTTVNVIMDNNKTVTAVFIKTYILTVTVSPAEGGYVFPGSGTRDSGSNITLTAVPATGYNFDHWEGAVSGNSTSVTITMDANKSVTAVFVSTETLALAPSPMESKPLSNTGVNDEGIVAAIITATNNSKNIASLYVRPL
jgi:hypothetical protein